MTPLFLYLHFAVYGFLCFGGGRTHKVLQFLLFVEQFCQFGLKFQIGSSAQ